VPIGYDFKKLLSVFEAAEPNLKHHHKYKNNYDYQLSLLLINRIPHFASENLLIKEDEQIASPISCLNYQFYDNEKFIKNFIRENQMAIQCIVTNKEIDIPKVQLGKSQFPNLFDFADNVDVMNFLLKI